MEFLLHRVVLNPSSYKELIQAFADFEFSEESYYCEGKIKQQSSGYCKYGEVKIIVENKRDWGGAKKISWEVSDEEIPIEYLDVIATTIKAIVSDSKNSFKFRIVGGSYHVVDSHKLSFEMATFRAISNLVGLDTTKV
ncbi:hypothetical protein [Flavobacterium sp. S87F.05.LMB.W.Kidney.N]|jgi:hypothetical protein|uniref:hypothetical protein n=1 Tax=Flavobacterium sp. S87F.05.LMB.W.Kidney.N TaxID=1278758 RepID=UPI0010648104|nr:hypothetical protein [Flavobacterium sp. S87F.05.LMB.W.Kidney.N]TDX13968.1 hypothetical protein EDB96_0683 [Flavobacterium sp. S87F.05.LMB.W.Kidney.N]